MIRVVAAVIEDQQGRVLLARRHKQSHQGGLWEFPGGKLEPSETVEEALVREVREELGILVQTHRPMIRIRHQYSDRHLELDFYRVLDWQGEAVGLEGQPLAWVHPEDLSSYPMPEADRPVITALNLPDSYLITPADSIPSDAYFSQLSRLLGSGISLVQFRVFGLSQDAHRDMARQTLELCHEYNARLLINADLDLAEEIGADGVHLSSRQLRAMNDQSDVSSQCLSASCHSLKEVRQAQSLSLDFVVLSPVFPTQSHPDAQPLGWERFSEITDEISIPVYALGGLGTHDHVAAWHAGAQGVAGIRSFWARDK